MPLLQASAQSDMKIFNSECTQRVHLSKTNRWQKYNQYWRDFTMFYPTNLWVTININIILSCNSRNLLASTPVLQSRVGRCLGEQDNECLLVRSKLASLRFHFGAILRSHASTRAPQPGCIGLMWTVNACGLDRGWGTCAPQKLRESPQGTETWQCVEGARFGEQLGEGNSTGQRGGGRGRGTTRTWARGWSARTSGGCGILGLKVSFLQFDTGGKETTDIMARIKKPGCEFN